ncbi:MAG: beta-propeller domain-containing protein [Blautia sp.]
MEEKKRRDSCMQEENKKKSQMDAVKKSAEKVEVPEELRPENLDEIIHIGKEKQKKKIWIEDFLYTQRKRAAVVAACTVLAVGAYTMLQLMERQTEKEAAVTAQAETAGTTAEVSEKGSTDAGNTKTVEGYKTADSYEEIHKKIYEENEKAWLMRNSWYSGDEVFEEEKAMDQSSVESAAMETGASYSSKTGAYSETNVRTEGVDEGDLVKTDGAYIYTLTRSGKIRITKAEGSSLEKVSETSLENLTDTIQEMYVDGNILCIVVSGYETGVIMEDTDVYSVNSTDYTKLYTYDISDKANPVLKGMVSQDGYYQTSRKTGDYVYLFSQYYSSGGDPSADKPELYIPRVAGSILPAEDVLYPVVPQTDTSQLVISSVNLEEPGQVQDSRSLIGACSLYYVSSKNIYVCTENYEGQEVRNQIARFSYEDGTLELKAAGQINGIINNSFSLDEYDNYLRVVVTRYVDGFGSTESNSLYVLDEKMNMTGKIEDLAKGETIRSARFMGETGYFVTYKQTDPLFSVNLKDPQKPEILGELKITGFSQYLHFYGENRLLGIGWETDPDTGIQEGLKLSMFDISNPAEVKEVDKMVLKDVDLCSAADNYKGILIDPKENIFGFGMGSYSEKDYSLYGYYGVFTYSEENGFSQELMQSLSQMAAGSGNMYGMVDEIRGVYIGSTFYLCGDSCIYAFNREKEYQACGKLEW